MFIHILVDSCAVIYTPLLVLGHQALLVMMWPSSGWHELPFLKAQELDADSFPYGGRAILALHTEN